jgi:hypothetical protein
MPSKIQLAKETPERKQLRIAYHRAYNELHKTKINEMMKAKKRCEICNVDIAHFGQHLKSKKHIRNTPPVVAPVVEPVQV